MAGKEDIVTRIARRSGHTKKATYEFMKIFGDILTETLADGERFHIHKVITFRPMSPDRKSTRLNSSNW